MAHSTVRVFALGIEDKLGPAFLRDLDVTSIESIDDLADVPRPLLLILHRKLDGVTAADAEYADWILCVHSEPHGEADLNNGRKVRGLPWALTNAYDAGQQQPAWKLERLRAFLVAARESGEPPWEVLREPLVPEYVIACYICALYDETIPPAWEGDFNEEVMFWKNRRPDVAPLEWSSPAKPEVLRKYLANIGVLGEQPRG